MLQRSIPDDRLGRVFALFDMIVNIALVTGITATAFASLFPDNSLVAT